MRQGSRGAWSLRTKAVLIVVLPAVALVGATAALFVVERETAQRDAAVAGTVAIDSASQDLLQLLTDAETGVRGFVATGNPRFLEPEQRARRQLPTALDRMDDLADDPTEIALGARLRTLAGRELLTLQSLRDVDATHTPQSQAEIAELALNGKAAMDAIRTAVGSLRAHEALVERRQDGERAAVLRRANRLTVLLGLLGLLGGIGGAGLLMERLARRVRQVERNAKLLAAGQPLRPMEHVGRDEVGSLAAALDAAARLIADQRRRLQLALEVGQINIWEVDASGRMLMQGDRAEEYGDTMEAGLATLSAEHAQTVRDAVAAVRLDGLPRDYQVRNARDRRWFSGRVIRSSGTDVIAVSSDVTSLRQAEQDLRESESRRAAAALEASESRGRYQAMVIGSAGEGIVSADARGVCTSANPAAAQMLGYEVSELVGQSLHPLMHHSRPDGRPYPVDECPMRLATLHGRAARVDDEVFWRRDGSRLPVEYSVSPLTEDGIHRGAVVTFADASNRWASTEELERATAALRQGIREGELRLHYQPKIHLPTGRCDSVEALVRWQRGDTLVFPDEFIPLAEQTGAITDLTDWVIDEAARQAATWRRQGHQLRVAVNLSALSLTDDYVVQQLVTAAEAHHLPVSQLEVELTETALAANPDAVVTVLAQLAAMGVRSAIDDFGSGYSSLTYLKHLPVSELKIDKSFVMNMPQDNRDQAIVAAAIQMAHSLGLQAVAEGVENDLVLGMLRRATCDTGQGYHWTRPLPAEQLQPWLSGSGRHPARRAARRAQRHPGSDRVLAAEAAWHPTEVTPLRRK
jgi:PAS domain S-box-containing protein